MRRFGGFSELVGYWASAAPDRLCLRFFDGGEIRGITWAQFERAIAARVAELAKRGTRCEAVLPDGSPESVVEVFAVVRAGLQVALIDANLPDGEAVSRARRCDADALWCVARRRAALIEGLGARWAAGGERDGSRSAAESAGSLDAPTCESVGAAAAAGGKPASGPVSGAVLFFTSGTTSAGKVVQLTEKSLMASAFNGSSLMPLHEGDDVLCVLPLSHVFGFVCGLLWGMQCGAPVALGRGMRSFYQDLTVFDPVVCPLVPALLAHALDARAFGRRLRLALVGAAPCSEELVRRARMRGIDVSAGYGLTETSSGVALSLGSDTGAMTVCPDCEVKVSASHEILIKAPTCLMMGYYGNPKATKAACADGFLKTGDEGFLDAQGRLHVRGRRGDALVLPNGEKLRVPACEEDIARGFGNDDCAIVEVGGRPVLAFGKTSAEIDAMGKDDLLKRVTALVARHARGALVADVVRLGHPLPRTASGEVQRWRVQEEVERWQQSKR